MCTSAAAIHPRLPPSSAGSRITLIRILLIPMHRYDWRFMEFHRVTTWMPPLHELLATASRESNDGRQTFGRVKMHFPQAPHR
jgi:hypothetical protein